MGGKAFDWDIHVHSGLVHILQLDEYSNDKVLVAEYCLHPIRAVMKRGKQYDSAADYNLNAAAAYTGHDDFDGCSQQQQQFRLAFAHRNAMEDSFIAFGLRVLPSSVLNDGWLDKESAKWRHETRRYGARYIRM